eukprot:5593688-Pyramimonas_sp.AAC.1
MHRLVEALRQEQNFRITGGHGQWQVEGCVATMIKMMKAMMKDMKAIKLDVHNVTQDNRSTIKVAKGAKDMA